MDKGRCCWNCDHFQRYDSELPPKKCEGECRIAPLAGSLFVADHVRGMNTEQMRFWPYIGDGLRHRCAHFEKSTEQELPQSPMSVACKEPPPTPLGEWSPWARPDKVEKTCWYCEHYEPEEGSHKAQPDVGSCLYNPPLYRSAVFPALQVQSAIGVAPTVPAARVLWCSCWEGPRAAQLAYTPDQEELTPDDVVIQWEARHERLVWMSTFLQKRFQAQAGPPPPGAGPPPGTAPKPPAKAKVKIQKKTK